MKQPLHTSNDERRQHPRIPFSLDVDWGGTLACVHKGRVTSLSIGGCFLETPRAVAEGKPVFIRVLLAPGSESATEGIIWGRVVYQLDDGIGVKFKKLPPGYKEHIEDIVEFHLSSDEND